MQRSLPIAAISLVLAACGGSDGDDSRFSLAVTDAPVDEADEVVVTFTGVELRAQGGEANLAVDLDPTQPIDLLTLQGDQNQFLVSDLDVAPGIYSIRLAVDAIDQSCSNPSGDEASYVTIDGTRYPLGVPSGEMFINQNLTIAAGGLTSFTVDFDLRKSLAERGSTGCYNINPTALRVVDNAEVGVLTGTVDGDLLVDEACPNADPLTGEGAAVYLFTGGDATPDDADPEPLTTALLQPEDGATGDFTYTIGFVLGGSYTAAFTCQASQDEPEQDDDIAFQQVANDVVISAGQTTQQDFSQTAPAR